MSVVDRVQELCEPIVADLGLDLFDLEYEGGVLRVSLDKDGGADLGDIAEATRRLSRALDEHDPVKGRYTLEVSTPGLERTLRTPAHFRWALHKQVAVKTHPGVEGERRVTGTVEAVDESSVSILLDDPVGERRTLAYPDIERARTVFIWESSPKPGGKAASQTTGKPGKPGKPGKGATQTKSRGSTSRSHPRSKDNEVEAS